MRTKTKHDLSKRLRRDLEVHPLAISLEALMAKVTPENRHPLLPWGAPRGIEIE